MCGFLAIISNRTGINPERARNALNTLIHRGPDAEGIASDNKTWFLGHRRLSIIDLSENGNQPLWLEGNKLGIVFNGEIYNYRELRNELGAHLFVTETDTEVILRGFLQEGTTFFSKLRGIYAFTILDLRNGMELFAVRDPAGVKPLYLHQNSSGCILASEIKAIKKAIQVPLSINQKVLQAYLQLGYCPEPETAYNEITTVKPGFVWHWTASGVQEYRFKTISISQNNRLNALENQDRVAELLRKAVHKNLISDVPCSIALSGGIDSSLVYYYAQQADSNILALTVGFDRDESYNETELSKAYSASLNGRHEVLSMDMDADLEHLNVILKHFDQPFADTSAIPLYFLTKASKEYSKVLIGGDGGDELFNGYPFMHLARALFKMNKGNWMSVALPIFQKLLPGTLGRQMQRVYQMIQYPLPEALVNLNSWIPSNAMYDGKSILQFDTGASLSYIRSAFVSDDKLQSDDLITAFNFRQILLGDYLRKTDMMSMFNGVELRVPFLDEDLTDFAMSIPFHQKSSRKKPKKILRNIHQNVYKGVGSNAPKSGFRIPLDSYLSKKDKQIMVQLVLSCGHPILQEWINPNYKKTICNLFLSGEESIHFSRGGIYQKMVQLYALVLWLQDFDSPN